MTWREYIEKHAGNTEVLTIVNREFSELDGESYDDEMPNYVECMVRDNR